MLLATLLSCCILHSSTTSVFELTWYGNPGRAYGHRWVLSRTPNPVRAYGHRWVLSRTPNSVRAYGHRWVLPHCGSTPYREHSPLHNIHRTILRARDDTANSIQPASYSLRLTTQHTYCSKQNAACSIQHVTYNKQHTAYSVQHTATAHSTQDINYSTRNVCPRLQNNSCALHKFDAPNTLLLYYSSRD
jgi:hypothetical protein